MNLNIPILPTLTNSIKSDIFLQQNLLNNKCMKSLLKITKAGKVTLELFRQRQYMNNAGNNPLKPKLGCYEGYPNPRSSAQTTNDH